MTTNDLLTKAKKDLDSLFGEGYSLVNPAIFQSYFHTLLEQETKKKQYMASDKQINYILRLLGDCRLETLKLTKQLAHFGVTDAEIEKYVTVEHWLSAQTKAYASSIINTLLAHKTNTMNKLFSCQNGCNCCR